jgi:hypothetical protein
MASIANTLTEIRIDVAAHRSTTEEILKGHQESLTEHGNTLYGSDGQAGLRVDLAILKDTDQRRAWQIRTIIAAIVTAVVSGVGSLFHLASNRP